jgi:hypothetical protein
LNNFPGKNQNLLLQNKQSNTFVTYFVVPLVVGGVTFISRTTTVFLPFFEQVVLGCFFGLGARGVCMLGHYSTISDKNGHYSTFLDNFRQNPTILILQFA